MSEYLVHVRNGKSKQKIQFEEGHILLQPLEPTAKTPSKRISWDQIQIMRINPPVATRYNDGHYLCTLVDKNGESTYLRAEVGDLDATTNYTRLINDLHSRLLARPQPPKFMTGLSSSRGFWLFAIFFGLTMLILIAVVFMGVHKKKNYFTGFLIFSVIVGVIFYFMKWAKDLLYPKPYDPKNVSPDLLPPVFFGKLN